MPSEPLIAGTGETHAAQGLPAPDAPRVVTLADLEKRLRDLEDRPWHQRLGYRTGLWATLIGGALIFDLRMRDSFTAYVTPILLLIVAGLELWGWSDEVKAARLAVQQAKDALASRSGSDQV